MSLLCNMKILALLLLTFSGLLVSCTSEYEERLEEARKLRERYLMVEESNMISPNDELLREMDKIQMEIGYLAKVSGNEDMFFRDLDR